MSEHRDAAAAPLWYSTLDAEGVAHAAAKGWDKLEPAQAALAAAQAARNLEKMHGGITSGEYARLPRADAPDEAKAFWQKLGTPTEAAGYKFDGVAHSDGRSLDAGYLDAARAAALEAGIPASMLTAFVAKMVPHMEAEGNAAKAAAQVAAQASKTELEAEWGPQLANNKFIASRAMDTLKVPPEAIAALEALPGMGYKAVMNHFLELGKAMGEARFVPGGQNNGPLNAEGAQAQLASLMADQEWSKRLYNGGTASKEFQQRRDLLTIIAKG